MEPRLENRVATVKARGVNEEARPIRHRGRVSGRLAAFALAAALCATVASARARLQTPPPTPAGAWPALRGRIGPYGGILTVADAQRLASDKLDLTVLSTRAANVLDALRASGAKYIDVTLWELIHRRCTAQSQGARRSCVIGQQESDAIAKEAAAHLAAVQSDPGLAAFWVLDDYPGGDVSPTVVRLREAVLKSNQVSGFQRATICGVGGSLDARASTDASTFAPHREYMDRALANLSPDGCDVVAPYFYGTAATDDATLIDWSMRDLLPYFRQRLETRGFKAPSLSLLPVIHAFAFKSPASRTYYVMPRPQDIAAQMKAYCDTGALGLLFFTWASRDADRSYSNDAGIRDGIARGRAACEGSVTLSAPKR